MKKVLVIIDVQNDFITGTLASEEAQKKIPNIVKKIRDFDGDCIFATRDTHEKNYLETNEGKNLPVEHCIRATQGWNIEPNVSAALNDVNMKDNGIDVWFINKPTFGSFELVEEIKKFVGKEECKIEILGFCTDICVVSNVLLLKAALYEHANIIVDASCCAGVTPDTHNASLTTMKSCQINVINE